MYNQEKSKTKPTASKKGLEVSDEKWDKFQFAERRKHL